MITGVTSHVLQVDGAAHVISDDRHDVRLLTGVKVSACCHPGLVAVAGGRSLFTVIAAMAPRTA